MVVVIGFSTLFIGVTTIGLMAWSKMEELSMTVAQNNSAVAALDDDLKALKTSVDKLVTKKG